MSLIDKLKSYIKKEDETPVDENEQINMIYDEIVKELNVFKQDFSYIKDRPDFKDKVKVVEDRILSLIEENDKVLTLTNENLQSIGMLAADLKLENVVIRALDNEEESTKIDGFVGNNLGMYAAINGLEKATLKALDNHAASCMQNSNCDTIGMITARSGLTSCVLKALDNKVSSLIQDWHGDNLGMVAAKMYMEEAVLKALDNDEMSKQVNNRNENIGIISASHNLKLASEKALKNKEVSGTLDAVGKNLGMYCAENGWEDLTLIALDDHINSIQQDKINRFNIGMYAALKGMKKATMKALMDMTASHEITYAGTSFEELAIKWEVVDKNELEVAREEYNKIEINNENSYLQDDCESEIN